MSSLIKYNNENYRCKNCSSPKCVLLKSDDKVITYYKCLNCGQEDIVDCDYRILFLKKMGFEV